MPGYFLTALLAGLYITDTPLFYKPPVGPNINFTLTYNQRDAFIEPTPNYSNLGPQWTFGWFTYIADVEDHGQLNNNVTRYLNSVGQITYAISNVTTGATTTGVYYPDQFGNVLQYNTKSATNWYNLTYPDGSQQIYAPATSRR